MGAVGTAFEPVSYTHLDVYKRQREITRTFVDDALAGFERRNGRFPLYYVCFTQYDATMPNVEVAFHPQSLNNVMGEYLAKNGRRL